MRPEPGNRTRGRFAPVRPPPPSLFLRGYPCCPFPSPLLPCSSCSPFFLLQNLPHRREAALSNAQTRAPVRTVTTARRCHATAPRVDTSARTHSWMSTRYRKSASRVSRVRSAQGTTCIGCKMHRSAHKSESSLPRSDAPPLRSQTATFEPCASTRRMATARAARPVSYRAPRSSTISHTTSTRATCHKVLNPKCRTLLASPKRVWVAGSWLWP